MTGIIDYGAGNLRSVQKALEYLGEPDVISDSESVLDGCDRLILPGVGAFGQGMEALNAKNCPSISAVAQRKCPFWAFVSACSFSCAARLRTASMRGSVFATAT